ncbi:THUMP domain-containing protein [Nanoarchaeota archaeon]
MSFILRLGETTLKGKNRPFFEKQLLNNVQRLVKCKASKAGGRLYVESEPADFRRVFGLTSFSPAIKTKLDYDSIEGECLRMAEGRTGSFKIRSQRLDKKYTLSSMELNVKLGASVVEKFGLKVKMDNPDLVIGVEVTKDSAYVFSEVIQCFGGLPVGCEGQVSAWIEDKKSLLAALLLLKRGCYVIPMGSKEFDISLLRLYGCDRHFRVCEMKDFIGEALVVGDTLETFKEYNVSPVLRPLIGYSEERVDKELKKYESVC